MFLKARLSAGQKRRSSGYLGENVVNEKEYRSAILNVAPDERAKELRVVLMELYETLNEEE
jgi:hypothetical protein